MRIIAPIPDMSLPPVGGWQRLRRLVTSAGNVPVVTVQAGPLKRPTRGGCGRIQQLGSNHPCVLSEKDEQQQHPPHVDERGQGMELQTDPATHSAQSDQRPTTEVRCERLATFPNPHLVEETADPVASTRATTDP